MYRLLDPATGKTTKIEYMDCWAQWGQPMSRPFQPASERGIIWVAFSIGSGFGTLGRFDTQKFHFRNWIQIDTLDFDSNHVWVDESARKFYVVYRGQLCGSPCRKKCLEILQLLMASDKSSAVEPNLLEPLSAPLDNLLLADNFPPCHRRFRTLEFLNQIPICRTSFLVNLLGRAA